MFKIIPGDIWYAQSLYLMPISVLINDIKMCFKTKKVHINTKKKYQSKPLAMISRYSAKLFRLKAALEM